MSKEGWLYFLSWGFLSWTPRESSRGEVLATVGFRELDNELLLLDKSPLRGALVVLPTVFGIFVEGLE